MTDVRIICTYDALKFAETLMRLLDAEDHQVRLHHGRQSLLVLEEARAANAAVLLIWSFDAPRQTYMVEWARAIDPLLLVEVARAPGAPPIARRASVIDFTQWRGERGGRAWTALAERLRAVARVINPPAPPPKQALLAMGLASMAAVGGAFMVRMEQPETAPDAVDVAQVEVDAGIGGALEAVEPPSAEDTWITPVRTIRFTPLHTAAPADLRPGELVEIADLRDPTLLERLSDLNPLRGRRDS